LGPTETTIHRLLNSLKHIHMTLIDPEKADLKTAVETASSAERAGSSAIMVGGSTLVSNRDLDEIVKGLKEVVRIPVILFPNNLVGISPYADAIWFMSLLNSSNPYYFIEAQALGASLVKRYGLEAIPMAYLIVGEGCAAGFVGHARPISYRYPAIAAAYALAGVSLGMRFVYLEAGSGAKEPVPPEMVSLVKQTTGVPIIVGGGIRSGAAAREAAEAGADIIVTGTILEEASRVETRIEEIVAGLHARS